MKRFAVAVAVLITVAATSPPHAPPSISLDDLRARLQAFAHDSMLGRATGTDGARRAEAYIVSELQRLGIAPGGENGSYTQTIPLRRRQLDLGSAKLSSGRMGLKAGADFLPITSEFGLGMPSQASVTEVRVLRGGRIGDSAIAPGLAAGAVITLYPPRRPNGQPDYQLWNVREQIARYKDAAAILIGSLELMPRSFVNRLIGPRFELMEQVAVLPPTPPIVAVKIPELAASLISVSFRSNDSSVSPVPRNILAIVEGSDAQLKNQFVLLSANLDHLGIAQEDLRIGTDSIFNGADDGGTGAVALVEIARQIAAMGTKPRRTLLFLWTAAHEDGLLGAEFFADHPTVSRDSIVASIVLGGIGRGGSADIGGGGPGYLEVHGRQRLSTDLGEWADTANQRMPTPFVFAQPPVAHTPQPETCDGDDWHFSRWGIPSVRVSTGRHADYHSVRDDLARIDFDKLTRVTEFVSMFAQDVANQPARPRLTGPKPDPRIACVRR